jgi:hypothetical protein
VHAELGAPFVPSFQLILSSAFLKFCSWSLSVEIEPGGWLQWEEVKSTDNEILKPDPAVPTLATDQLVGYVTITPHMMSM